MIKSLRSERGGTLMLVFGFIVMISLILIPLAMNTNIGLLQAKTNGNTEAAFNEAQSAMTIFGRLYEDMTKGEGADSPNNTDAKITELVEQVNRIPGLDAEAVIVRKDNKPVAVTFTAKHGASNQVRSSTVKYRLAAMYSAPSAPPEVAPPTPPPVPSPAGPTPTPTPPPANSGKKVLLKNGTTPQNNKLFAACYVPPGTGETLPLSHILNNFTNSEFDNWFGGTANYYLNQSSNVLAAAFQNVFSDPRYEAVTALNSTVSKGELSQYQTGSAIIHEGNVNIAGSPTTVITQDMTVSGNSNGDAVVTSGNLHFKDIVNAKVAFNGHVKVGGNLLFRELKASKTITFNGNLMVKGNVVIGEGGTNDTIVVEGDLIVGGNLTVKNTFKNLYVKGDIIVAGDVAYNSTVLRWHVNGGMVVKGNLTATNGITSFDIKQNVTVKGNMMFTNPVSEQSEGVTGLFSIGGSLKVNGMLEIRNTVYGFLIGKDVIVNQDFIFYNVIEKNFKVSGTIHVKGNFSLKNTVRDFNVTGDVIIGNGFTVDSTLEKIFQVGGSLVTNGSITFKNTIQSAVVIKIGENLISKSNLKFNDWTLNGSLDIGNMLLVFGDAAFHNMSSDWNKNKMKGFYVKGTTSFNPQYADSWYVNDLDAGRRQESICIR